MWKIPSTAQLKVSRSLTRPIFLRQRLQDQVNLRTFSSVAQSKPKSKGKAAAAAILVSLAAFQVAVGSKFEKLHAEAPTSTNSNKKDIYSQHRQVIESLQHPGVYLWGYNKGGVIDPESNEEYMRTPRRLRFFENVLLRDLKLGSHAAVAVDEKGDVLQWGAAYSKDIKQPEFTLTGKDIQTVALSATRVFALSKDGTIYSFPISRAQQQEGPKPAEPGFMPFLTKKAPISYKTIQLPTKYFEQPAQIATGLDHLLILTTDGRLFACAASNQYPARGQLGIPGLRWGTHPRDKPFDAPHLVSIAGSPKITQIAAGDLHSLALDSDGKVWSFGDNIYGQLGFPFIPELDMRDIPTELAIQGLYPGRGVAVKCTGIAAGGLNSYYQVDALQEDNGKVAADVWASGQGLWGALGNGRWTHVQGPPILIKKLSGLMEYDDATNRILPIRVAYFASGRTHVAVVMATRPQSISPKANEILHGQDVMWWGNNEFFQLGTGRRNNLNVPSYIPPLDTAGDREKSSIQTKDGDMQQVAPQDRLQVTPRMKTVLGNGRKAEVEQRVVAGDGISAVYSKVDS